MNGMKKKLITSIGCIVLLGMVSTIQASPMAYEGFDYSGTTLAGANGGVGWNTSWKSDAALTTDSIADVQAGSLAAPAGLDTSGNHLALILPGGQSTAFRGLASSAQLDLGVDATYYMSILHKRYNGGMLFGLNDASGNNVFAISLSSSGKYTMLLGADSVSEGVATSTAGAYLTVIKIEASAAGNDQASYIRYYETQTVNTEPTAWTLTSNGIDLGSVGSTVKLFGGSDRTIQYDEIRLGTTWASVIPEPTTLGLLGLVFRVLFGLRRLSM